MGDVQTDRQQKLARKPDVLYLKKEYKDAHIAFLSSKYYTDSKLWQEACEDQTKECRKRKISLRKQR